MHTLIFVSTVRCERIEELSDTLSIARDYRSQIGNSGLTLMAGGNMMVMIQGSRKNVETEFKLAERHAIFHQNVIQLLNIEDQYKFTEGYPLLFKPLYTPPFNSLNNFQDEALANGLKQFLNSSGPASTLIKTFIQYNH